LARGQEWAIGLRSVFKLAITFSTASAPEKVAPNRSQLDVIISPEEVDKPGQ
jgi:hypothetical protein